MEPIRRVRILNFFSASLFFVLCILLPMVGPAAVLTPHYGRNRLVFGLIVVIALVLASLGTRIARQQPGIPLIHRRLSTVWTVLFAFIFTGLLLGLFET